eukprot:11151904-Ditylum_brightwellii.AAC.1
MTAEKEGQNELKSGLHSLPFDRGPEFLFDQGGNSETTHSNSAVRSNPDHSRTTTGSQCKRERNANLPSSKQGNQHFGDTLTSNNDEESIPIGFMNVQSLPQKHSGKKNFDVSHMIKNYNFSHLCLVETNINWNKPDDEDRVSSKKQAGGTMSITAGKTVGHIAPKGKGKDLSVVTFYRSCKPSGPGSVYTHHATHYDTQGTEGCPRVEILKDLKKEIKKWRDAGDQVVLMCDINNYIYTGNI